MDGQTTLQEVATILDVPLHQLLVATSLWSNTAPSTEKNSPLSNSQSNYEVLEPTLGSPALAMTQPWLRSENSNISSMSDELEAATDDYIGVPPLAGFADRNVPEEHTHSDLSMALYNDHLDPYLDNLDFDIDYNMAFGSIIDNTEQPRFSMPQPSLFSWFSQLESPPESRNSFTTVDSQPQAHQGGHAFGTQQPTNLPSSYNILSSQLPAPEDSSIEMLCDSPPSTCESGTKRKRRGALKQTQLRETNLTRGLRACIRCSMQKIRVRG